VACALGAFTFFPVGLSYLGLLVLLLLLLLDRPHWQERWQQLRPWLWLLLLPLLWALLVLATQGWHEDSATRLFHLLRVALVLGLGLTLLPAERWLALYGLLAGAVLASALLLLHQLWPLPDVALWRALLSGTTGNSTSQKFILLAAAAAAALWLALQPGLRPAQRAVALLGWLLFAATVATFSVSRNAQLLLLLLPLAVFVLRWHSWRPLLGAAVALLLGTVLVWQFSPTVQPRFEQAVQEVQHFAATGHFDGSASVRLRMYQHALEGMAAQPLLGTGLGSWLPSWRAEMAESNPAMGEINNPHNDFLLTGMEKGVPGLLLLLALLAALGWHSLRQRGDPLAGVAQLLLWTLLLTTLVNAPFRDANLGLSLLWLLAVCTLGSRPASYIRPRSALNQLSSR
jgi:O-antigen ligase